jgi:hypothetical protein
MFTKLTLVGCDVGLKTEVGDELGIVGENVSSFDGFDVGLSNFKSVGEDVGKFVTFGGDIVGVVDLFAGVGENVG